MQLRSGQVSLATTLSRKAVLGTERSGAENSLSIPNCVDECNVDPGERTANRLIGEGKAGDLLAPQEVHLCDKPTGNRSREGTYLLGHSPLKLNRPDRGRKGSLP